MSKLAQIYGLTVNEALKLNEGQVQLMMEHAEKAANELLAGNAAFKNALSQRVAGVKRAVRAEISGGAAGPDEPITF
ncbi:MAG: hypothetical protein ACREMQ_00790 [Longimicrobiales bacterium]